MEQYIIFRLNNQRYAIDIGSIDRIIDFTEPKKIPETYDYVLGVIKYDEKILPVVDLTKKLYGICISNNSKSKVIVTTWKDRMLGFLVEDIEGIQRYGSNQIEKNYEQYEISKKYIEGFIKLEDDIIIILNIQELFDYEQEENLKDIEEKLAEISNENEEWLMVETIKVGISDYKITTSPNILMTLGLGSCVGIAIYDTIHKVGGLSHILLPDSSSFSRNIKIEKFANLAIPKMVSEMKKGYSNMNLIAKIAGGASMFEFNLNGAENGIGEQNVLAVKRTLESLGIPIVASHTGGNSGRTMIVNLEDFKVTIRCANSEIIII